MMLLHAVVLPVPVGTTVSLFSWASILYGLLWTIPFLLIFVWQKHHGHKHSHSIEKKLEQIIKLMKKKKR